MEKLKEAIKGDGFCFSDNCYCDGKCAVYVPFINIQKLLDRQPNKMVMDVTHPSHNQNQGGSNENN